MRTIVERGNNSPEVEGRVDRIVERAGEGLVRLNSTVCGIVNDRNISRGLKYIRLVELADKLMPRVIPDTPCRKGCSACCHIACAISEREAKIIGLATGRTPQPVSRDLKKAQERVDANIHSYYGVPCTFLGADKACTIYEARPMACRIQHSLNETAQPCEPVPGDCDKPIVPQVNLTSLIAGTVMLDLEDGAFGDIREFFPPEPRS